MNKSYLVHKYIDEGLPSEQEKILFSELASNSSFREEFQRQMKIHIVASKDMNSIAPPADLKNSVFAAVGFSSPAPAVNIDNNPNIQSSVPKASGFNKIASYTLIAILSVLLTVGVYETMNFNRTSIQKNDNTTISENKNLNVINKLPDNLPLISSYEANTDNSTFSNNNDGYNIHNNMPLFSHSSLSDGVFITNSNEYDAHQQNNRNDDYLLISKNLSNFSDYLSDLSNSKLYKSNEYLNRNSLISNSNIIPIYTIGSIHNHIETNESKFVLLFNRDLSHVKPNKNNINPNSYDNMSLSGIYRLNSNHAFGIEVSYQNYNQEFPIIIGDQKYTLIQSPKLLAITPFYKYSTNLTNYLSPYIQAGIGATSVGPIGKLVIGGEVKLVASLKANLSYGASALIYNVDNKLYSTNKYGFVYGLSYGF